MSTLSALKKPPVTPSAAPVLIGLIGAGIAASRTPLMHEREGERLGLRYIYRKLDTDSLRADAPLADILQYAEFMGFTGLNVTYPFKQQILPLLDELSENARAVGAVNTVVFRDGRRFGHNTDIWGFAQGFRTSLPGVARERVLQIGAGGAGAAVAHALMAEGVGALALYDTDTARAKDLADDLCQRFGAGRAYVADDPQALAAQMDGIVNATPVGMDKLPGLPLCTACIAPAAWVADIIYFPLHTRFLTAAQAKGCKVMNGAGMAVYQAVRAFELFTGILPDAAQMQATFDSFTAVQATA
jgi:shikimate dehydrogenase